MPEGASVPRPATTGRLELERLVRDQCIALGGKDGGCSWVLGKRLVESEGCPVHALLREPGVANRLIGHWMVMPEFCKNGRRWPWDALRRGRAG